MGALRLDAMLEMPAMWQISMGTSMMCNVTIQNTPSFIVPFVELLQWIMGSPGNGRKRYFVKFSCLAMLRLMFYLIALFRVFNCTSYEF